MAKGILMAKVVDHAALVAAIPAAFPVVFGHHVTLAFGVDLADVAHFVGRVFNVRATVNAHNGDIHAVRVDLPAGIPCGNAHPHITISANDGVKPVASNAMLAGDHTAMAIDVVIPVCVDFHAWN